MKRMAPSLPCMMTAFIIVAFLSQSVDALSTASVRAKPWESVSEPLQEQSAKVIDWATEAQQSANEAGAEAKQAAEMSTKASGTMAGVMAKVGAAKEAMVKTFAMEQKVRALRDALSQKAHQVAEQEVPKMLQEMRVAADKTAAVAAKRKAMVFGKAMKAKAQVESAKAAKVYTDAMNGASKNAAQYANLGDTLIGQSATMQMKAGLAQGAANQYIMIGDMPEAQKLLQQSRGDMNTALSLNGQATGMYNVASKIGAQLGAQAGQAAMAAFHAQVMYDPDAVPPPPPLVLVQGAVAAFKACDEQKRFDIMMCKSHMCTKCTLAWCTEKCQAVQKDFPTCRCKSWPKSRASFSGGKFAGKGKFGDAGDYAKAASAFLSLEIKDDA